MQLCKGIPEPTCDGKVLMPSGQCLMCMAYHPASAPAEAGGRTPAERERAEFEQFGVLCEQLKPYLMTYNAERNTYYNAKWDLAWESWQAARREERERTLRIVAKEHEKWGWASDGLRATDNIRRALDEEG